jgi:predicted nucleotidyltransferase
LIGTRLGEGGMAAHDIMKSMSDTKKPGKARASGRFLLRMPPTLHAALRRAASEAGVSLNDYCVRNLASPGSGLAAIEDAVGALRRAAELFGERLVGVVVLGARSPPQAAEGSDVDLLVVVDRSIPLTRELYRRWDRDPIRWEGRSVEPHFTHLPDERKVVAGVWAEVALDGVVLFERSLAVSRRLSKIRRDIAEGRIVRKMAHGQPYWADVA